MSLNNSFILSTTVKTVLIGETSVGKSSIINRFIKNTFKSNFEPTLSGICVSKEIKYTQINKSIRFEIWDTAGQEIYRSLTKIYYKNASIIIFVYDITRKDTFEEIRDFWYKEVINNCSKDVIFAIVGNKDDNYEFEEVDKDSVIEFSNKINAIFRRTSAKTGFGIKDLFFDIGLKFLKFENKEILSQSYDFRFKSIFMKGDNCIKEDDLKENNSKLNINYMKDDYNNSNCCG